jgi:hypothetical protein
MSGMTVAERQELGKLVRLNAKVAKDDADARGKWLIADAEAKLAAIYKAEDKAWADITAAAQKHVKAANAAIAALCRERCIPRGFRPSLHLGWYERGENEFKERRAELRKVVQSQVAARVKEAQVEIDRQAAQQLTQIAQAGLTSEEARAFIRSMPRPEEMLPPLGALTMDNGELVTLEVPVTQVTVNPAGETPSRINCASCGKVFTPNRRDGKHCSSACRVKAHSLRQRTDGLKDSTGNDKTTAASAGNARAPEAAVADPAEEELVKE